MASSLSRHPEAECLAEHIDGLSSEEASARVLHHLAGCAECRIVVSETVAFLALAQAVDLVSPY